MFAIYQPAQKTARPTRTRLPVRELIATMGNRLFHGIDPEVFAYFVTEDRETVFTITITVGEKKIYKQTKIHAGSISPINHSIML